MQMCYDTSVPVSKMAVSRIFSILNRIFSSTSNISIEKIDVNKIS